MAKIKFCGLTRAADAAHAASLDASYAGVIFAESPRQVTPAGAREIFEAADGLRRVGVFSRERIPGILRIATEAGLDVLQLHGHFTAGDVTQLREEFEGELWALVPVEEGGGELSKEWRLLADVADALVLDTSIRGYSGGTGRTFDWKRAAASMGTAALETPIVLAGGLTPANVAEAMAALHPAIVDVSSGVEAAPGIKQPELMSAFAKAVRSASIVAEAQRASPHRDAENDNGIPG